MKRNAHPPIGIFQGVNIMTQTFLEYGQLSNGNWYELSEGRFMNNERIIGVTVRPDKTLSKLCYTVAEAIEYLKSIDA